MKHILLYCLCRRCRWTSGPYSVYNVRMRTNFCMHRFTYNRKCIYLLFVRRAPVVDVWRVDFSVFNKQCDCNQIAILDNVPGIFEALLLCSPIESMAMPSNHSMCAVYWPNTFGKKWKQWTTSAQLESERGGERERDGGVRPARDGRSRRAGHAGASCTQFINVFTSKVDKLFYVLKVLPFGRIWIDSYVCIRVCFRFHYALHSSSVQCSATVDDRCESDIRQAFHVRSPFGPHAIRFTTSWLTIRHLDDAHGDFRLFRQWNVEKRFAFKWRQCDNLWNDFSNVS